MFRISQNGVIFKLSKISFILYFLFSSVFQSISQNVGFVVKINSELLHIYSL